MAEHQKDLEGKHAVKKRISWRKVAIVLGIIAIIVGGYFLIKTIAGKAASVDAANASSLEIAYTLKLENGTVLAQNTSSFKPGEIGSSFGLISDKLDKAIESLREGQSTTVTLSPEDAFGEYNESYVSMINRTEKIERNYVQNRTFEVPLDEASQAFNETPEINKSYKVEGQFNTLSYTVLGITEDSVNLSQDVKLGDFAPFNQLVYGNITKVTDDEITFLLGADEQTVNDTSGNNMTVTSDKDYIYFTTTPIKGGTIVLGGFFSAKVVDYNETDIVVDANGPLAGKKIIVEVKLIKVEKSAVATTGGASNTNTVAEKTDAPTVDAYVFAYCPYGLQFEKALLPAYDLLKDKAEINIVFIGAMHGAFEKTESLRQLCIQKEYSKDKLFEYLNKFTINTAIGNCNGDDNCLSPLLSDLMDSISIDKDKIDSCMESDGESLYNQDVAKASQLGVGSSPTFVVNGAQVQVSRTPDAVKKAICDAFTITPDECSQTLSLASASAGFGSGSGSTGSSCGA